MSKLFVPIGISGSGKSYLGDKLSKVIDLTIICPDDERKLLTGDISNQSKNDEVFSNCYRKLNNSLAKNENVYFSATNLSKKDRKMLFKIAEKYSTDVIALVLTLSKDFNLCLSRVKEDISKGIDRSNTISLIDGQTVVERQYKKFIENINGLSDEHFLSIKEIVNIDTDIEKIIKEVF